MTIDIREVRDLDEAWEDFAELFRELYEYHRPLTGQQFPDDWQQRIRMFMDGLLRNDQGKLWMAYDVGRGVGFLSAIIRDNAQERVGQIDNAYVRAEHRGRRIASQLLERAEAWFKQRGVATAQLNVVVANDLGRDVWEHLGYELFSEQRRKRLT